MSTVTTSGGGLAARGPGAPADPDALEDIASARVLVSARIPVFAARPALDGDGQWDPTGGTGGTGYWFPRHWESTVPTPKWLDPTVPGFERKAWRPGWALVAVMGHGLDLLDVDPRHGGDASRAELVAAGHWPKVYCIAATPSGGTHEFIASLGVRSRDNLLPGLDVKAGMPDGTGRGVAFLAPTVRVSKVTGELARYRWRVRP